MKSRNDSFINRISYILMWVAAGVAAIGGVMALASYLRYGNNNFNRDNIALFVRFAIFAILLFVYRKIFIRR